MKIGKFFNTAGPIIPADHYNIDPLMRFDLEEIEMLIYQKKYFVLHAPRQTGKTSCLFALRDYINARGRTDLLITKPLTNEYGGPKQRIVLELKIKRGDLEKIITKGLEQTIQYMDKCGGLINEGHFTNQK